MYVTRPLSMYKQYPSALSLPPPEGPHSGCLVIQDEEEVEPTRCFGLMKNKRLKDLPFPQNKILRTLFIAGQVYLYQDVVLIPVLNQPLSFNRYYAIKTHGKQKGEAYTNSNKEDTTACCFRNSVSDVKSQPFDPKNIHHQVEIHRQDLGGFSAKSVAPDGSPPEFLRRKGWYVYAKQPRHNFYLSEASGVDAALRSRLPTFNLLLSEKVSKPVVVGKWYCPFMFIKESTPREQMKRSMFYEMTLEQRWEQIFSRENDHSNKEANDASVLVDVSIKPEVVSIHRNQDSNEEGEVNINTTDGVMWFKNVSDVGSREMSVGLSLEVIENMKWEEERFGWAKGNEGEKEVNIKKRIDECGGGIVNKKGEWKRFGCYVLVERFVLKRMDGSLVLSYGFRHTNHIRSKWE